MNPHKHSQIERALYTLDKSGTVDILKDNQYLLFLFKKTERIATALYVITGLLSDSEPLRNGIRESSIAMLRHVLSLKEGANSGSKERLSDVLSELAHLFSLIDIAYVSGLLSPMNFSIIKKELEGIRGVIESKNKGNNELADTVIFDEHFFGIPKDLFPYSESERTNTYQASPLARSSGSEQELIGTFTALDKLKHVQKDTHKGHNYSDTDVFYKKSVLTPRSSAHGMSNRKTSEADGSKVKDERIKQILEVLQNKKVAMIKDFSSVIQGCSEKTIQRLLIELVQSGVLKKEGDRRWSRYSVASK